MRIGEKINFNVYVGLSIVLILFGYLLSQDLNEFKVILTVFFAACINHYMLCTGIEKLTRQASEEESSDGGGLLGLFLGKIIVLIVALIFGVQIMGKRIIIPVLIYVLQIGVLYFSFKKTNSGDQGSK